MTTPSVVPPIDSDNLKRCSKCGEWKPRTEFAKCSAKKDGLHPICRQCDNQRRRDHYAANADRERNNKAKYFAANRETLRARGRAYRTANIDAVRERDRARIAANRDERNRKKREAYAANPAKHREQARMSQAKHRERRKEYQSRYQRANKDALREYMRAYLYEWNQSDQGKRSIRAAQLRRRARKRSLPDTFTADDWQAALAHFGGCCAVCGRPPGLWHILAADHWIPLSSPDCPGTVPWNIVPLCHGTGGCNNSKWNRCAGEWLTERFGQRKAAAIQRRVEAFLDSQK